jgi:hypothetical protein
LAKMLAPARVCGASTTIVSQEGIHSAVIAIES